MTTDITNDRIKEIYQEMLDGASIINSFDSEGGWGPETQGMIANIIQYLIMMLALEVWTTEDMTPINEAIIAGRKMI